MAGPVDFRSTTYFVDQEGAPTLVAVKRQSDTRLRREVVGEMLDYAANAVVYWPVEQLRSEFEANCPDPEEEIRSRLHVEDAETLWQRLKTNLQAGRIRMLFVADQIPAELRRIVEFLNQQMDPAEMLALGLRRFAGEGGLKIIVPGAYGETEEAKGRKGIADLRSKEQSPPGKLTKAILERRLETVPEAEKPQIKSKIAEYEARIAAASGADPREGR